MDNTTSEVEAVRAAVEFAGTQSALAHLVGVPAAQVSQWASGARPVPAEHCVTIERATGGVVKREQLKPRSYWLIWPDLPSPSEPVVAEG